MHSIRLLKLGTMSTDLLRVLCVCVCVCVRVCACVYVYVYVCTCHLANLKLLGVGGEFYDHEHGTEYSDAATQGHTPPLLSVGFGAHR